MYSKEKGDAICELLAGGSSLRAACAEVGGVSPQAVLRWVEADEVFSEQYARARAIGYQLLADDILEISDDSKGDVYQDADGNERTDTERVARAKLRVDSRKWMLSKMLPKMYGDKVEHEHKGEVLHSLTVEFVKP